MKNRNFPWVIIAAAAVAGAGFAGVASYVMNGGSKPINVSQSNDDQSNVSVTKDPLSGGNNASSENGSKNSENPQKATVSKVDALNKAIKLNKFDQKGIRVLDVTVENGNAIVDMNDPVRYNWGSQEESEFLKMMSDTLEKFDSINTFQIRVDGEILKALSHLEIDPVKVR